jgi:hypothetical protein
MLTMLFLYLMTNSIIDMSGAGSFVLFLIMATLIADSVLIEAVASRIKGRQK